MADIDAKDRRIQELQAEQRRETEAAEARAGWEPIVRPRVDSRAETLAEAEFRGFLAGQTQSRAIDLDLSGVIAERRALRAGASGKEFRDLLVGSIESFLAEDAEDIGRSLGRGIGQHYATGTGTGVVRQLDGTTPAPVTWDRLAGSSTSAT